jgi:quercetin dioxygenase-like cupin family protein
MTLPDETAPTSLFEGTPDFEQGTDQAALVMNPVRRGPFRPVDLSVVPSDRFFSLHLFLSEEVIVYLSGNAPALAGPPPHAHSVDQFFFQLSGSIELVLGQRTYTLNAGDWAYIPAGVEHKHRNLSATERELHLEVMAPGLEMSVPFMIWAGDPAEWKEGGVVVPMPAEESWRRMPGGNLLHVLSEASGSLDPAVPESTRLSAWYARTPVGGALNSTMHVHDFHQFYYVIEGALEVQVGVETRTVGPHTLVVIPPGVPHRNRVVGEATETHIHLNVPSPTIPSSESPWDVPVRFEVA